MTPVTIMTMPHSGSGQTALANARRVKRNAMAIFPIFAMKTDIGIPSHVPKDAIRTQVNARQKIAKAAK